MLKVEIKSVRINVNYKVRVEITECGYRCWDAFHRDLNIDPPDLRARMEPGRRTHVFQLHELMLIFGSFCGNGFAAPFATEIELLGDD